MNYEISDDLLERLSPTSVITYLYESGWEQRIKEKSYLVFRTPLGKTWDEVVVPTSKDFSDYSEMMMTLLRTIANSKLKTVREIYSDIISGNYSDCVQYRLLTGDESGLISVDQINQVIEAHRLLSAVKYLEITDPKDYYPNISTGLRAVRDMRMGQTAYGSYIVKFYYPSDIIGQRTIEMKVANKDIFTKLPEEILISCERLIECAASGSLPEKEDKISYNFVDKFISLQTDQGDGIELSVPTFDIRKSLPILDIPNTIFPRIRHIADEIKPDLEEKEREFMGKVFSVTNMGSDESDPSRFRVEYFDDEGYSKASIVLDGSLRKKAVEAVDVRKLVKFKGTLRGYGSKKSIENVSEFTIIE